MGSKANKGSPVKRVLRCAGDKDFKYSRLLLHWLAIEADFTFLGSAYSSKMLIFTMLFILCANFLIKMLSIFLNLFVCDDVGDLQVTDCGFGHSLSKYHGMCTKP